MDALEYIPYGSYIGYRFKDVKDLEYFKRFAKAPHSNERLKEKIEERIKQLENTGTPVA